MALITCESCLEGKHFKCRAADCACNYCKALRQAPEPAPKPKRQPRQPRPKPEPRGPRGQFRSYPSELVEAATVMKRQGASWPELAAFFDRPAEGLRYALNAYGPPPPPEEPEGPHSALRGAEIERLEGIVKILQDVTGALTATLAEVSESIERLNRTTT